MVGMRMRMLTLLIPGRLPFFFYGLMSRRLVEQQHLIQMHKRGIERMAEAGRTLLRLPLMSKRLQQSPLPTAAIVLSGFLVQEHLSQQAQANVKMGCLAAIITILP